MCDGKTINNSRGALPFQLNLDSHRLVDHRFALCTMTRAIVLLSSHRTHQFIFWVKVRQKTRSSSNIISNRGNMLLLSFSCRRKHCCSQKWAYSHLIWDNRSMEAEVFLCSMYSMLIVGRFRCVFKLRHYSLSLFKQWFLHEHVSVWHAAAITATRWNELNWNYANDFGKWQY